MTKLIAKVKKWNHNREVVSLRMSTAEPHVMRFIGDCGREMYGEEATDMMRELMEKGHLFEVATEFEEADVMEFSL